MMYFLVGDGPFHRRAAWLNPGFLPKIFKVREVRAAALGYFGHMWELYSFWVFVPVFLAAGVLRHNAPINVSLWVFMIIGAGSLGCIIGGLISKKYGSSRVALLQLAASGLCCLLAPLFFSAGQPIFLAFLIFWGIMVVGDSPQFSALIATSAPPELVGTALTTVNCLGFMLSIISIEMCNFLFTTINPAHVFLFLTPGPILGVLALFPLLHRKEIRQALPGKQPRS